MNMSGKNILAISLLAFSALAWAGDAASSNKPVVYSKVTVYPESGDCGGFTVTLLETKDAPGVEGFLQVYEGNCESEQAKIKVVKFDKRTGELSFSAPSYVQDGKGGLEVAALWKFSGRVDKNMVVGGMQYCQSDGTFCSELEKIRLARAKHVEPE